MYILMNQNYEVLITETSLITGEKSCYFAKPEAIKAINSYRNKDAKVKTFYFKHRLPDNQLLFMKK